MFRNILRPDSGLMIVMTQITDCIFLSLFWILGCFPVVTIGASCAALYDATYRGFREGEKNDWQRFLRVFRRNWKSGIVPTLLFLLLGFGVGKGLILLWNGAVLGKVPMALFPVGAAVALLAVGVLSLVFPVLSRFENTPLGLLKNTLLLALAQVPRTLLLGVLYAGTGYLCVRFLFPLFFLPSLAALLSSWLVEPMFRPFLLPKE